MAISRADLKKAKPENVIRLAKWLKLRIEGVNNPRLKSWACAREYNQFSLIKLKYCTRHEYKIQETIFLYSISK